MQDPADLQDHTAFNVPLNAGVLALGPSPLVMGILNVTPDSFSDGGELPHPDAVLGRAKQMRDHGADILDIGGESTRPDAEKVRAQLELDRIMPVFDRLTLDLPGIPLSIDTYKAVVADQAIQAGAHIINDVTGLQGEPEMADVAALYQVPVVAMHWDKERDREKDLITEIKRFFERTISIAEQAGVKKDRLILDPGFGFSKTLAENYQLLRRLNELRDLGCPILVGMSRKSMIGKLGYPDPKQRLPATLASSVLAFERGAHILRVHDIAENKQALTFANATQYGPPTEAD